MLKLNYQPMGADMDTQEIAALASTIKADGSSDDSGPDGSRRSHTSSVVISHKGIGQNSSGLGKQLLTYSSACVDQSWIKF